MGSYLAFPAGDVPHRIALTDADIRAMYAADGQEDRDVLVDVVTTCSQAASKLRPLLPLLPTSSDTVDDMIC